MTIFILESFNERRRGVDVHSVNYNTTNYLGQISGFNFFAFLDAIASNAGLDEPAGSA